MAQQGFPLYREKYCCPICLELLKEPATLHCGHSFCMSCIQNHWDSQDGRTLYSCPECREAFTLRPTLQKNIILVGLMEELKKVKLQAAPADHCYAGPEDVACDICTERKLKATKACLDCRASFCEKHLQFHLESPPLMKHKLVEPSVKLEESICCNHDEVMMLFCRTDQQCICYLCSVDEHKGHDTVSAAAERTEKQRELVARREEIQERVQDREKDVTLLQQEVEAINDSADKAVDHSEWISAGLIRLVQKRSSNVRRQIRSQQETEVGRVLELRGRLEQEIAELKREDAELKQLEHTDDHAHFLHSYPSLPPLGESMHPPCSTTRPLRYFEDVTAATSKVMGRIQDILSETWTSISWSLTHLDVLLPDPEPETRAEFLKYSQEITLDPNTANSYLLLSEGNSKVMHVRDEQLYSDHPDRFTYWRQVLSRNSLSGRCYWEVQKGGGLYLAVAYKNISRAGQSGECLFGFNDKSWALVCDGNSYAFYHNTVQTTLSGPKSSRVGVYLHHRAGVLSFYSVSNTMTLLHRVHTTFTQPLYGGVCVFYNSTAEFCKQNGAVRKQ